MSLFIEGIGTASPSGVATQDQAAASAEQFCPSNDEERRQLRAIYRLTRVKTRHSVVVDAADLNGAPTQSFFPPRKDPTDRGPTTSARMKLYEAAAPPLALEAARVALADSGRDASEITHLITVSCTGFVAPGFDVQILRGLGLRASTPRLHVGFMGCHGVFHALRTARAFTDATPEACVIVCSVELCSIHFQYGWSPDLIVANALFADGAAAVVASGAPAGLETRPRSGTTDEAMASATIGAGPGPKTRPPSGATDEAMASATTGAGPGPKTRPPSGTAHDGAAPSASGAMLPWELAMSGAALLENSNDEMTWRIGDHGFQMTLSSRVPGLIQRSLRPWLDPWLATRGLSVDRIASWAVHPGGPRILESCAEVTGCTREDYAVSHEVLANFGNMSSPTILFILDRLRRSGAPRPCLALGFGPGLSVEGALFT